VGIDERQPDARIEERARDHEQDRATETAGTEPDRIWGADDPLGDAVSPGT